MYLQGSYRDCIATLIPVGVVNEAPNPKIKSKLKSKPKLKRKKTIRVAPVQQEESVSTSAEAPANLCQAVTPKRKFARTVTSICTEESGVKTVRRKRKSTRRAAAKKQLNYVITPDHELPSGEESTSAMRGVIEVDADPSNDTNRAGQSWKRSLPTATHRLPVIQKPGTAQTVLSLQVKQTIKSFYIRLPRRIRFDCSDYISATVTIHSVHIKLYELLCLNINRFL